MPRGVVQGCGCAVAHPPFLYPIAGGWPPQWGGDAGFWRHAKFVGMPGRYHVCDAARPSPSFPFSAPSIKYSRAAATRAPARAAQTSWSISTKLGRATRDRARDGFARSIVAGPWSGGPCRGRRIAAAHSRTTCGCADGAFGCRYGPCRSDSCGFGARAPYGGGGPRRRGAGSLAE
jgi:hypothetical protein